MPSRSPRWLLLSATIALISGCPGPSPLGDATTEAGARDASDANDASDGGIDVVDVHDATVADVLMPPPIVRTQSEAQLAPQRAACTFHAGAWPAETIGAEYPVGD